MIDDRIYKGKALLYEGIEFNEEVIFYCNDVGTSAIVLDFYKDLKTPYSLEGARVAVNIAKKDGNIVTDFMNITGENKAEYIYPINGLTAVGKSNCTILVYDGNGDRVTFGTFKFRVRADINGDVESTTEYPVLNKLISDVDVLNQDVNSAEALRIVEENHRKSNEVERKNNENDRVKTFNDIKNEYSSIKGIMIDENNAANLQNQINVTNSHLDTINKNKLNVINVKEYGAKGDGVTDDSLAIKKCIELLEWNGGVIYFPKGTYLINDKIDLCSYGGIQRHSIELIGESQDGTVLLKNEKSTFNDYVIKVNGYQHSIKNLTILSAKQDEQNYYARKGIYITGYPMPNCDVGCKFLDIDKVKIRRCNIGIQFGNYDVDLKDPDIETNNIRNLAITECNMGVFFNGQNILNNPITNSHFTDCRDYLVYEKRGSEIKLEYCYLGNIYDYLTSSSPTHNNPKILNESGATVLRYCRNEDNPPTPLRITVEHKGSGENVLFEGNQFTTANNNKNGTSLKISGNIGENVPNTTVVCINNQFEGIVVYDTCNIISIGNTYQGQGGTLNGYILSANQKNIKTNSMFLDNNIPLTIEELNILKGKPINMIKENVATNTEFSSMIGKTPTLVYGQYTQVVRNSNQEKESCVHRFSQRFEGDYTTGAILFAPNPPSTGTWQRGDRIFNSEPSLGNSKGWICCETGTPGTWISEGNL